LYTVYLLEIFVGAAILTEVEGRLRKPFVAYTKMRTTNERTGRTSQNTFTWTWPITIFRLYVRHLGPLLWFLYIVMAICTIHHVHRHSLFKWQR